MAHATDRTLLANLGFADPDKKLPEHDIACQYIAQPENLHSIASKLIGRKSNGDSWKNYEWVPYEREWIDLLSVHDVSFEFPISKGRGQYKTTIGFLDLIFHARYHSRETCGDEVKYGGETDKFAIEVKITPVLVASIIRQINLYREFESAQGFRWLLVTHFPISKEDNQMLKSATILHVRLGSKFDAFLARQKDGSEEAESEEI